MAGRGLISDSAGRQMFCVVDNVAFKVAPNGARSAIGTLITRRGTVGMVVGLYQLVIVDGPFGYVYDLGTGVFTQITSPGWRGSKTVDYLNGYFVFIDPNSQTFYVSSAEDALTISALDTADAVASPDKLVGTAVTGRVLVLFGTVSGEVWQDTGEPPPGVPFSPNSGAFLNVGLLAPYTAKGLDNTIFWLGRDDLGAGIIYKLEGFQARRVSTMAVEEVIQQAIRDGHDASTAVAFAAQIDGRLIYSIQIPGLNTTWTYDVAAQQWHERAEFVNGDYRQHRGRYYCYCYGQHLILADDDIIYAFDPKLNTNAGDVLVRDRVSPHFATPDLARHTYSRFELDCTVGVGKPDGKLGEVLMRYSDDGGNAWSSWRKSSLGAIGERTARARFLRCGSGRDRVWQVRCTDDIPFAIIAAPIEAT